MAFAASFFADPFRMPAVAAGWALAGWQRGTLFLDNRRCSAWPRLPMGVKDSSVRQHFTVADMSTQDD